MGRWRGRLAVVMGVVSLQVVGCGDDDANENANQDASGAQTPSQGVAGQAGGDTGTPNPAGAPMPILSAAGIGVGDLPASTAFYASVFELADLYTLDTPVWKETVLQDVRGNHLVIMDFVSDRPTMDNPVKLVFAVADVAAYQQRIVEAGGDGGTAVEFAGTTVALGTDLDGYTVELIQVPTVPSAVLVAVGIGVSDIVSAEAFYTQVLGLEFVTEYDIAGLWYERELASPRDEGMHVVLMDYAEERSYANIATKLVFAVDDAAAFAARIADADPAKILQAPEPYEGTDFIIGMATDDDGYLLEILQSTAP